MEEFLGIIKMFAGDYAPEGWAFCNGQQVSISELPQLYALIGTTYGGDGRLYFYLPDLRGRAPVCEGQGPGLSTYYLGQQGGKETDSFTRNDVHMDVPSLPITGTIKMKPSLDFGNTDEAKNAALGLNTVYSPLSAWNVYPYRSSPTFTEQNYLHEETVDFDLNTKKYENPSPDKDKPIVLNTRSPYIAISYIISLYGTFPPRP